MRKKQALLLRPLSQDCKETLHSFQKYLATKVLYSLGHLQTFITKVVKDVKCLLIPASQ